MYLHTCSHAHGRDNINNLAQWCALPFIHEACYYGVCVCVRVCVCVCVCACVQDMFASVLLY